MYFVSCNPHLTIDVDDEAKRLADKQPNAPLTRRMVVQFAPAGAVPLYAREAAARLPGFYAGIGRDEDPYDRMGWFDSVFAQSQNGWSESEREFVEQQLLASGDPNVMLVEPPRVAAPYPKYDEHRKVQGRRTLEHVVADIGQTFEVAGFDVAGAVAYERQNLNDPKVIEAIEKLGSESDAVEQEELVSA